MHKLRSVSPNCNHCDWKAWSKPYCNKHRADIPANFIASTDCPDWIFDDVPF